MTAHPRAPKEGPWPQQPAANVSPGLGTVPGWASVTQKPRGTTTIKGQPGGTGNQSLLHWDSSRGGAGARGWTRMSSSPLCPQHCPLLQGMVLVQ